MVKWSTVCTTKEKGGLGIRSLSDLNMVLLGKWIWRFALEVNSTWREFVNLKYGTEDGHWFTQVLRGSYGVSLWKEINKEIEQLKHNCCFKIGYGSRIKFWEDEWFGENTLMAIFPSIYTMASTKGARVEELCELAGVEGSWNLRLERHFYDW